MEDRVEVRMEVRKFLYGAQNSERQHSWWLYNKCQRNQNKVVNIKISKYNYI